MSLCGRPLHIVGDHQVEFAVAIVIDPRRAGAELVRSPHPCRLRDVRERAVPVVVEEVALAKGGNEHVVKAVIVVITYRHAHSVHRNRQPGFRGHIGEGPVVVVVIQLQR